ncbi:MAG: UrcA family protein [Pseudomonadota bacterium]
MKISHALTIATAMAFTAAPALADSAEVKKMEIDVSVHDLNSEAGIDAAYEKIKIAAKRVCRTGDRLTAQNISEMTECRDRAIVEAIESLNEPTIRAAFAERAGKTIS